MKDSIKMPTYTRMRRRIHWLQSLLLLWTAVAACRAEGSIHTVSLNMDGLLTVTNQNLVAVVCRVTHNSTNTTTRFYVNGTVLDETTHPLVLSRAARVSAFSNCYEPPAQDRCQELTLLLRVAPQINNTRITCRSRPRDRSSTMAQTPSRETITVILKEPDVEATEPPSCSPPSASPSPSPSPSPSSSPPHLPPTTTSTSTDLPPTPAPSPGVDPEIDTSENKSPSVLPEGRERWYAVALAAETVALTAAIVFCVFLTCCYCKNRKRMNYTSSPESDPADPEFSDSPDTKEDAPTCTSYKHTTATYHPCPEQIRAEDPRYEQCSHV